MILQNFDVKFDDPNYKPVIKQALTIKPDELYIRATPRVNATTMDDLIHSRVTKNARAQPNSTARSSSARKPMTILYGSNTGTCQAFAQRLASDAGLRGFQAEIRDLDGATNALPHDRPIVVITSSYEGQPPDNAARFIHWLPKCEPDSLRGIQYTVFGCGHRECAPLPANSANNLQATGARHFTASPNSRTPCYGKPVQSFVPQLV